MSQAIIDRGVRIATQACTVCGATCDLDQHHIAGRHVSAATIPLCRTCHADQTSMQWRFGVLSRRPNARSEIDRIASFVKGIAGTLNAGARGGRACDPLIHAHERARRVTLRLLAVISEDRPGAINPRPVTNDLNRRPRKAGRGQASPSPAPLAAGLLPALATTLCELTPDAEAADIASRLAADPERLSRGLEMLESHPRADELHVAIGHTTTLGLATVQQLGQVAGTIEMDPDSELIATLTRFRMSALAWLDVMLALGAGNDPNPPLDRFLTLASEATGPGSR